MPGGCKRLVVRLNPPRNSGMDEPLLVKDGWLGRAYSSPGLGGRRGHFLVFARLISDAKRDRPGESVNSIDRHPFVSGARCVNPTPQKPSDDQSDGYDHRLCVVP